MGQARQRKMEDPYYGKPKERGLIISPPTTIGADGSLTTDGQIHPQELRFSLLFWDKLVWPDSSLISFTGSSDDQYLVQRGVMEKPHYTYQNFSGMAGLAVYDCHLKALNERNAKEPGAWALLQGPNALNFESHELEEGAGASIELVRAIPIPTVETPLEEILEFKVRRSAELLAFRHHIEALSKSVHESADQSAELNKHISDIQKVCSDLTAVGKEFQFPMHVADFKASLKLHPSLVGTVMGAWSSGSAYGLEIATIAAAAAGIKSMVKLQGKPALRSLKAPSSPYKYAYHINREFI